jgi:DNA gyrase/topoisomerase IV subunit A
MKCSDKEEAIKELCNKFGLSLVQARGICEAEIGFLTRVNSTKLDSDIKKYENIIADYDYKLSHIDEVIIEEIRELEKKYKRDRKTEITDNINENNKKTSIHISNGVLLYNKDSVGIFDSSAILNSKIILNTMRSYKIDGKWKKEIIFYQPVHKDLYGIIVFYNNGLAKRIKMSDIPLINTWIPILEASLINPISTIVPIYEDENLEIVTVSSDGKIKRFLASDISTNMKVNVGNVIAALSLREYDEIVILYNNKGEYLCIEKDDIPLLSRNAQGNKTGFDGSDQLYLTTLKEHNDMIGIMYSDDSSGYIYGLRESELKYGSRTNKPKPFLNIKLKNLKFNGIFPLTTESKNDTSIVFIGNMVLTTVKTRLIKFDESRKIGIAAFGGVQITH